MKVSKKIWLVLILLLSLSLVSGCGKDSDTQEASNPQDEVKASEETTDKSSQEAPLTQDSSEQSETDQAETVEAPTYVNYPSGDYDHAFVLMVNEEETKDYHVEKVTTFESGELYFEDFFPMPIGYGDTELHLRLSNQEETIDLTLTYHVNYEGVDLIFETPEVEAALRQEFGIEEGTPIKDRDIDTVAMVLIKGDAIVFKKMAIPWGYMEMLGLLEAPINDSMMNLSLKDLELFPGLTTLYATVPVLDRLDGVKLPALKQVHLEGDKVCGQVLNQFDLISIEIPELEAITMDMSLEPQLKNLIFEFAKAPDLGPISRASNLKSLLLDFSTVSDYTFLEGLTNLERLSLRAINPTEASIEDHKGRSLIEAGKPENRKNSLEDISVLSHMSKLISLDLSYNRISDLSPLGNLKGLERLNLATNHISDISVLSNLVNLKYMIVSEAKLANLDALTPLTNLTTFEANFCGLESIDGLANNLNMEFLWVDNNQISDISVLNNFIHLKRFLASTNQISDISPAIASPDIEEITVWENPITNPEVLDGLGDQVWVRK